LAAGIHALDRLEEIACEITIQAGTEQGIDDDAGIAEIALPIEHGYG